MTDSTIGDNGSVEAFKSYARRIETLLADQIKLSADFTELRKEVNGDGFDYSEMKATVKDRLLDAEDGGKRIEKRRAKNANGAIYLDLLAPESPKMEEAA
jgi:uncharacterized protein (UPF0335 family)